MAKVFIGIALVFMLATAGVGFMLKGNVDKLQSSLTKTKGQIADAEGKARAAKNDAEKAQKEAKDAGDKLETANQTATAKTKEAADSKQALDEQKALVESSTAKIAQLEKAVADAKTGTPAPQVEDPRIAELTTKLQDAEKGLNEQKQVNDSLIAKGKDNESKVAELEKKEKQRALGVAAPGLQGRILAVNSGWNFVVLSVGDKQGVMVNSPLLVVRGNEPIARLRITSVEPSTSIADVLPGTLRRGASVQPGDTVIFEGGRGTPHQSGQAKPTDAGAAAPLAPTAPALPNN